MLSLIFLWLYISLICLVFGHAAVKLFRFLLKEEDSPKLPLSLQVILGLGLISAGAGYLSLFINLGLLANCIVFSAALVLISFYHREITSFLRSGIQSLFALNRFILALLVLSFLFILLKSAAPPSSFDTGLYHAQAIRWIEEYPVIPGLGNLHSRLAFNSAWFPANALFGFPFLQFGPVHALNGFLMSVMLVVSLKGLDRIIRGPYFFSDILRAALILPALFVFKDQLSSPAPDLPAALLTCLVFIFWFQFRESGDAPPHCVFALAIVLLATLAITIKLSALPLALLMLALTCREIARKRRANILIAAGLVLFLALPFFLRNIWLSGYLLYPLSGLDLFSFDWKISAAQALEEKRAIVEFARDPGYLAPQGAVKTPFAWLPYWLPQTLADYRGKLEKILLPALLLFLDWLVHLLRMRTCRIDLSEIRKNGAAYLTVGGGLFIWFFSAPDLRFVLGFLMVFVVIIFIPFLKAYDYRVTRLFPWAVSLILLYFLAAFAALDLPAAATRLLRPLPYPQAAVSMKEIQGHKVYFPSHSGTLCWYAPLPCAYRPANFAFRGNGIADGFKPRTAP
ncbi:MAG: hypothetical protein C4567_08350 [Deltaproteobacteria bacterium]|nr:MAG: hypothetical protein C4567_08350 [Deltaproteobacteria bacterium]